MGIIAGCGKAASEIQRYNMTTSLCLMLLLAAGVYSQSCVGRCGIKDTELCQCNSACETHGDCCSDYVDICYSCQDRCSESFLYSKPCQCNDECPSHGNCCADYDSICAGGGGVTDAQLRELTEALLSADVNNVGSLITVDRQGKGTSGDLAPEPYFVNVPPEALSGATIAALIALQDNYIPDVNEPEVEDPGESQELDIFLDAIMATEVMALAESFLIENRAYSDSCLGRCGEKDLSKSCQCNSSCKKFYDCCKDYFEICFSCQDRCGEAYLSSKPCQCNDKCPSHGNCCDDYNDLCGGGEGVTDNELRHLTESLLSFDVNNVGSLITVDPQGKGSTSEDVAPGPFFTHVPPEALSGPTISALIALQDNYIPNVSEGEIEEPGEVAELENFLDAIMATKVMQMTDDFLYEKKLCTGSLRSKIKEIWFDLYPRGSGSALGSSGFEHAFVGEIKKGAVSGFHNWVYFYTEESAGNLDYGGWSKVRDFGVKGLVLEDHFEWLNYKKSVGSSFIATSPEFEIAVYTVCFLARPDSLCPVQMGGHQFKIQTWTYKYAGKTLIGSAYPHL